MTARCPKCHKPTDTPHAANSRAWYCHHCKMPFEPEDDGDISYGRPSKRLEREERKRHGPYPSLDAGD